MLPSTSPSSTKYVFGLVYTYKEVMVCHHKVKLTAYYVFQCDAATL